MTTDPQKRAVLSVASAAREVADAAYTVVRNMPEPSTTRERIRAWRRVRLRALTGLDRCVLVELMHGATWEEVADGYGLTPDEMRRRFEPTLRTWQIGALRPDPGATGEFSPGMPYDPDPAGTAAALDFWAERHAEPWMEWSGCPVSRAIAEQ